jgi:SAM-dependent methyltransferase
VLQATDRITAIGQRPVLIWGAGSLGARLAGALGVSQFAGFIDSDPAKWNGTLAGRPVFPPSVLAEANRWLLRPFVVVGTKYSDQVRSALEALGYACECDFAIDWYPLAQPAQIKQWASLAERQRGHPVDFSDLEGFDDEFWFWLNAQGPDMPLGSQVVAPLPPADIQRRVTGTAGYDSLRHGFNQYLVIKSIVASQERHLADCSSILEFGAGYGRILRFFAKDAWRCRLVGADVNGDFVRWCRAHLPYAEWLHNSVHPPLNLDDQSQDLVFAFSVFSHLSETSQRQWLSEIRRVLRKGGLAVLTVWNHPRTTWEYHEPHFVDFHDTVRRYEAGEFCYSNRLYGESQTYGEALVPLAHIREHWTRTLTLVDWIQDSPLCPNQNYVVLRRDD